MVLAMQEVSLCPCCGYGKSFRIYSRTVDFSKNSTGYQRYILKYILDRQSLTTSMHLCRRCMFFYLNPRFDEGDLKRFYTPEYFERRKALEPGWNPPAETEMEKVRASEALRRDMVAAVLRQQRKMPESILDFGGGYGGLIPLQLEGLKNAYVIDTGVVQTGEGITRLNDLDDKAPYDMIMCTHVLEHLAKPAEVLKRFKSALARDGFIYIEVPFDILAALKERRGISEHVNFFTGTSLGNLATQVGLNVTWMRHRLYPYALWKTHAVCAILEVGDGQPGKGYAHLAREFAKSIFERKVRKSTDYSCA